MNATQVLITIAVILAIVIMLFWLFGHNRADAGVGPRFHASTLLPRAPLPDEVQLNIFQYATGDHPVPVACRSIVRSSIGSSPGGRVAPNRST